MRFKLRRKTSLIIILLTLFWFCRLLQAQEDAPELSPKTDTSSTASSDQRQEASPQKKSSAAKEEKSPSAEEKGFTPYTIFDDKMLLQGYANQYKDFSKEILLAMIKDDNLNSFKTAAAVMVFNDQFAEEIFSKEKKIVEKTLLRRLNRTNSPFVQVEIMYTLCRMDRYRYFKAMIPALIQKLDHYNATVNDLAFKSLDHVLIQSKSNRAREARIVFNTLRKTFFLSRKRLAKISEPNEKLSNKIKILRWSIKILGSQELKRLPKEVINLL